MPQFTLAQGATRPADTNVSYFTTPNALLHSPGAAARYIDERGSGWIYEAPEFMIGDVVQFYSRRTLQPVGATNTITRADATSVTFSGPLPASLKVNWRALTPSLHACLSLSRFQCACPAVPG